MKIFSKRSLKALQDSRRGWYPQNIFREMVEREKRLSNRNGFALSYILIDLSNFSTNGKPFNKNDFIMFCKRIVKTVSDNTRLEDMKCLCSESEIGVLLVNTHRNEAEILLQKLAEKLVNSFSEDMKPYIIDFIQSIKIFSSPMYKSNTAGNRDTDIITSIRSADKEYVVNPIEKDFERISGQPLKLYRKFYRLNVNSINNGVLTLEDSYLWHYSLSDMRDRLYWGIKRIIDIIGSIVGIMLFLPIMGAITIAIKLTSKGPVLFKQKRIGIAGKEFYFYKFRSMVANNDDSIHQEYVKKLIEGRNDEVNLGSDQKPCYKIKKDPRITKIGQFLRNTSLDELPQLFNVLKGEMSLVGPRPPIPYEVKHYKSWHLQRVFKAKPGITGLWQLYGRSVSTFDDMVRFDLRYIDRFSPWLDLKIIFKTFFVFIKQNGAL